ncbi:DNA-binding transcriptional regulator, GntR family [Actinacidiphila yanglinensis]|uniref:DNA-binding transcriptional regulator, GntR family n=1 Tax=Actinacidiphila yanglinensis TaxID=310779 RepID=A0A1H6EEE0_9ACTN|nr:GntR family transcriptional regulator [Actinacidiphila yanglinensis]SEG96142.1 DNA-binding transcriptional regulator, GntR family [Actinacidiphila yanglinensis]
MKAGTAVPSPSGFPSVGDGTRRLELLRILKRSMAGDSIADEIAVAVATEIVEGRLRPGDDLNSVELARTFRSSRTPVREALLVLEREGFVEIAARRRPRVARLALREVRELYNLRAQLYALVSRRVVAVGTDADLAVLRGHQRELQSAADDDDVDRYFWANVRFRNAEMEIARDLTLGRVLDTLGLRALQLRHLSLSQPGRLWPSVTDHARLLRAYEDRDADLAAALTQSLVLGGLAAIERSGWTGEET